MKNKKVIWGILFIILVIGMIIGIKYSSENSSKMEETKVKEVAVNFEPITSHYLYNQLSKKEKNVYAQIVEKLDNYQGGEILLEEPLSPISIGRVADTIRYDGDRRYWYFAMLYCFNEENMSILPGLDQSDELLNEKNISKLLVQIDLGENQKKLKDFRLEYNDKNIAKLNNYEELRTILEETKPEEGYYEKINQEVEALEQQVIEGMPKQITQEQAVQYMSDWMLENMDYDYEMLELSYSMVGTFQEFADVRKSTSKACAVKRKGICSGLAAFMADIYNKIGIDANVVLGMAGFNEQKGAHAWVQVHIGEDTFYKDPTYENMYGSKKKLWNIKELKERRYTFAKNFKWD